MNLEDRSVDYLQEDLETLFKEVTREIGKAFVKVEDDAREVRMRPNSNLEPASTTIGAWTGILIGSGVVIILGLIIAWPIYCCVRKRGSSEDENEPDFIAPAVIPDEDDYQPVPPSAERIKPSAEVVKPSAELAKPSAELVGSAEPLKPSAEVVRASAEPIRSEEPMPPRTPRRSSAQAGVVARTQKPRGHRKLRTSSNPKKPMPGGLSPIGLSPVRRRSPPEQ